MSSLQRFACPSARKWGQVPREELAAPCETSEERKTARQRQTNRTAQRREQSLSPRGMSSALLSSCDCHLRYTQRACIRHWQEQRLSQKFYSPDIHRPRIPQLGVKVMQNETVWEKSFELNCTSNDVNPHSWFHSRGDQAFGFMYTCRALHVERLARSWEAVLRDVH